MHVIITGIGRSLWSKFMKRLLSIIVSIPIVGGASLLLKHKFPAIENHEIIYLTIQSGLFLITYFVFRFFILNNLF